MHLSGEYGTTGRRFTVKPTLFPVIFSPAISSPNSFHEISNLAFSSLVFLCRHQLLAAGGIPFTGCPYVHV